MTLKCFLFLIYLICAHINKRDLRPYRSKDVSFTSAKSIEIETIDNSWSYSKMFQTKASVFEKAVILYHSIFLSVETLKLRQGQLHFFKWNHVFFFRWHYYRFLNEFSDLQHKVILIKKSIKTVEKSKHIRTITFKGSTNLGLGLPTEDARSADPRLVNTC